MTSYTADKKLLLLILSMSMISFISVISVLFFLLNEKPFLILLIILLFLYLLSVLWLMLYFHSVKYEKGESGIKIMSGVIVKKYTVINTDTPPVIVNYRLPFNTGIAIVYVYGGTQLILSTKVL